DLVSEAEARRDVVEVAIELRAVVPIDAHEAEPADEVWVTRDLIGQRRAQRRIEPTEAVVPVGARRIEVVADAEVQGEFARQAPIVLQVEGVVEALRGDVLPVLIEVAAGTRAEKKGRETIPCRRAGAGRIGALRERGGEPERPGGSRFPHVDAQQASFITG